MYNINIDVIYILYSFIYTVYLCELSLLQMRPPPYLGSLFGKMQSKKIRH